MNSSYTGKTRIYLPREDVHECVSITEKFQFSLILESEVFFGKMSAQNSFSDWGKFPEENARERSGSIYTVKPKTAHKFRK